MNALHKALYLIPGDGKASKLREILLMQARAYSNIAQPDANKFAPTPLNYCH